MHPAARETNLTVTARLGDTVTADATPHAVGAWTTVIANTAAESQGLHVAVAGVMVNGTDTSMLLDIAHGDVGGGNEVMVAESLTVGAAGLSGGVDVKEVYLPCTIPSGRSIRVRLRSLIASDTAVVAVALDQGSVLLNGFGLVSTYGAVTASSRGTLVPCGNGAWGAWTAIGTTGADHKLFVPGYDAGGDISVASAAGVLIQLGYGATAPDAGGTAIEAVWQMRQTTSEAIAGPFPSSPIYAALPSGTQLWARLAAGDSENRGVVIHAIDGTVVTPGGGGGLLTHPGMTGGMRA